MGGVCSGGVMKRDLEFETEEIPSGYSGKLKTVNSFDKKQRRNHDPISVSDKGNDDDDDDDDVYQRRTSATPMYNDLSELRLSFSSELKPSTPARTTGTCKVPQMSSLLGRAGIVGLEVLDTLGSSMSNLTPTSGFVYGIASRGNKISILAFEVANTIVKGANLLQSLSEENILLLKEGILHSEGVNRLVSTDMEELLSIAAADKREEFELFSREVVRFGDLCKDPQWHNLGRYFQKLDTDFTAHRQLKEEAEVIMQELMTLAQHTSELYHELPPLDRLEQDYQRKLEELESLKLPRRGESVMVLHGELKHQRKHVRSLKKKSLWSKNLDEVVEKLVDIVTFIHQEIMEVFSNYGRTLVYEEQIRKPQRLGTSGLALHYANIINQIDCIVSRPNFLPPNVRDTLYHGLPTGVKTALRSRIQSFHGKEELTVPQIKAEMGKILQWIVPVAANTTKAHQGFGWVGEWANTGNEFNTKTSRQNNLLRIQTLYHAEKEKTEMYILELVTWLHRLISLIRNRDHGFKSLAPIRCPSQKAGVLLVETQEDPPQKGQTNLVLQLSPDVQDMLEDVSWRRLIPGISKSQEFTAGSKRRTIKNTRMSKSSGSSPTREINTTNLEHTKNNILDVIDGLDTTQ
ncbi:Protein of unknown function DUF668 [Macleaya cordata]|uniref:DUF668 domain-containing protein n=1 Tax=Macleaya cordata TaxID=56857 RepID=A0A200R752_MACCD|nr:Protein of unknown function DUF668 [Macleaya cordata]